MKGATFAYENCEWKAPKLKQIPKLEEETASHRVRRCFIAAKKEKAETVFVSFSGTQRGWLESTCRSVLEKISQ
jgi:hypothetical protein